MIIMQQVAIMGFGGTDKSIFSDLYVVRTDGILMTVTRQNVIDVHPSKVSSSLTLNSFFSPFSSAFLGKRMFCIFGPLTNLAN